MVCIREITSCFLALDKLIGCVRLIMLIMIDRRGFEKVLGPVGQFLFSYPLILTPVPMNVNRSDYSFLNIRCYAIFDIGKARFFLLVCSRLLARSFSMVVSLSLATLEFAGLLISPGYFPLISLIIFAIIEGTGVRAARPRR